MGFSNEVLWGVMGGIIGAALVAIIFSVALITMRRRKALFEPAEIKIEEEKKEEEALPAFFEVSDLVISPSQVKEGESVTVSALVANIGGTRGSYSVTLTLDKRVIAIKGVTLDPGSSIPVTFNLTERTSGEHTVEVDGLKGEFYIPPASFTLSNLTITPSRVKEGERATISVQVTNTGGSTGSHLVELKIRGATEMAQEVTLSPNARQTVSFTIAKRKAGFYPVEVGDLTDKITVEMADFSERI